MSNYCRLLFVLLLSSSILGCGSRVTQGPSTGLEAITPELIHRHVFYLASDSLKGRNTPSPELDTAAQYIARQFSRAGVQPVGGSYFQRVRLDIVSLGATNALRVQHGGKETSYDIKTSFIPFDMTGDKRARRPVVFAGYGISATEYHYDDYASVDVKGKIVFLLRHEPGEDDSTSVFEGKRLTDYSNVATKARIAAEHGAVGVLVATDPLNHTSLSPRGFPWPSLSRMLPKDALPITLAADEAGKVPVVHVGEDVIADLFGSVDSLRNLQAVIDRAVKPVSFAIPGAEAFVQTSTELKDMSADNVVGYLEGRDPVLKNEVIIVGAHYDHVGYKKEHEEGEDYIYNGADDNASGTSAMLAIAAGFGAMNERPRRSVLFIAFAGEEKGLFGSEFYVRHPLFPLEKTVAMINLDMVGRNSEDSLFIIGADWSPDLVRINAEENQRVGFVLVNYELNNGGSDHMTFIKKNIPILYYFSGMHADVHRVTDNPELINTRKAARISRLAFLTLWRIANEDRRYQFIAKPVSLF